MNWFSKGLSVGFVVNWCFDPLQYLFFRSAPKDTTWYAAFPVYLEDTR